MKKYKDHFSKSFMLIFIMILASTVYLIIQTFRDYTRTRAFYQEYQDEYEKEKLIQKELKSELLKNQDYYEVETQIRNKLNMVKPDEEVVILPQITPMISPSPTPTKTPLKMWKEIFFSGELHLY